MRALLVTPEELIEWALEPAQTDQDQPFDAANLNRRAICWLAKRCAEAEARLLRIDEYLNRHCAELDHLLTTKTGN